MVLTATLRGWGKSQPPIVGVGVTLEPTGVRVHILSVRKSTQAKTLKVTLHEHDGSRVERRVRLDGAREGVYVENPNNPESNFFEFTD